MPTFHAKPPNHHQAASLDSRTHPRVVRVLSQGPYPILDVNVNGTTNE